MPRKANRRLLHSAVLTAMAVTGLVLSYRRGSALAAVTAYAAATGCVLAISTETAADHCGEQYPGVVVAAPHILHLPTGAADRPDGSNNA